VATGQKDRTVEKLLGLEVTKRREELDLTQEELAFRAGLSTSTIQKYEAGEREPRAKALLHLARGLETTTEALLSRSNWVPPEPGREGYMQHRVEALDDGIDVSEVA
jgi:transcriptional regulator with XRE-family HTH domain